MKKTLLLTLCLLAGLSANAQDKKIVLSNATASSHKAGNEAENVIDGKLNTIWTNSSDIPSSAWPVTLTVTLEEATHVDYVRYIPRKDGSDDGNWNRVYISYCPTTTGTNFTSIGSHDLKSSGANCDIWLTENGVTCGQIKFTLERGYFYCVSAAEIEAYAVDFQKKDEYAKYFTDAIFSELKPEVTSSEGIEDPTLKALVDNLLTNEKGYSRFRIGEYEPYLSTETLFDILKSSNYYNNYENPTGIYLKAGETCFIAVDGIDNQHPVKLTIKNWVEDESSSTYPLRNGLNYITASTEGNLFVSYYTDDLENAPNIKIHFINAPVQGYWDQATMTNADWVELLKGRSLNDNSILITRSEHAQLAFPVSAWLKYCPNNVDSTMTLYQQVQWAQRNMLGLEKYGRQVKNRQLFFATTYGFMAAVNEGSYCNVNSLDAIMVPDAKRFDFWGVGHEWGHNNQIRTGFKWSGCGETTNNIFASWGQIHFTGNPHSLRLEDEVCGVGEYSNMRGGRMQTYFEEALRKGVPWQLQDGPDYYGTTPTEKTIWGYDADGNYLGYVTTTSRNYDHFVKLTPFWQLNLWGTLAGKCPDIIPMVIESIRSTSNYESYYNTNGKKQVNWMKLACDSAKIDLLPFFEKAGMLRPINAYIEDYNAGWNIITEEMIANLKAYVKEQGYPAYTEEINYINGHNYLIYRDCLKLEVPEEIGAGCTLNGSKVKVLHSAVKNAVAYETYNNKGELLRITMYGLGSDDQHSYTQVLYPKTSDPTTTSAYIMAVGYDGKRIKIYEEGGLKEEFFTLLGNAKAYEKRTDETGQKIGFLKPEAMAEFTSVIEKMETLFEQTDARERPYGAWITELETAIATLSAQCAPFIPNRTYLISAIESADMHIGIDNNGLKLLSYKEENKPLSMQWRVVQSETEGVYYIQHLTTGRYITSAQSSLRVKAESCDIADAVTFTIMMVAPGEFYIQSASNSRLRLCNENNLIHSSSLANTSARWFLQLEDEFNASDCLSQPIISTDEQLVIYRILNTDNGEYVCVHPSSRNKGVLTTGVYETSDDTGYWFYFKQGSEEGKYTIHNHKAGKPATISSNKVYTNKDKDEVGVEFSIALREGETGFTITSDKGDWYASPTSTKQIEVSSDKHTTWILLYEDTIEGPSSGISATSSEISIRCSEGNIHIGGLKLGSLVNVYDRVGLLVGSVTSTSDNATIRTDLAKGEMAIIVIGDYTAKVIMQ